MERKRLTFPLSHFPTLDIYILEFLEAGILLYIIYSYIIYNKFLFSIITLICRPIFSLGKWILKNLNVQSGKVGNLGSDFLRFPCEGLKIFVYFTPEK